MGNEILKVDSVNMAQRRELAEQSYDKVRGVQEQPSIWTNFSPGSLAMNAAFPLVFQRKEFQSVAMDKALKGKELFSNTGRMIKVNELHFLSNNLTNFKNADQFFKADVTLLKNELEMLRQAGKVSNAQLAPLKMKYFNLLDKNNDINILFTVNNGEHNVILHSLVLDNYLVYYKSTFAPNETKELVLAIEVKDAVLESTIFSIEMVATYLNESTKLKLQ